jgi:hypothetical protein
MSCRERSWEMNSLKKIVCCAAALVALAFASSALAGNPNGVVLDAPKWVTIDYTLCYNSAGALPCLAPTFTVANNTWAFVPCKVTYAEGNFVAFDGLLAPGQVVASGFTTGYVPGMKLVTLVLTCNDSVVLGTTQKIHILVGT